MMDGSIAKTGYVTGYEMSGLSVASRSDAAFGSYFAFTSKRKELKMMSIGYNGLWGLLILAGDIWAIINILQSSASNEKKLIWVIAVVLLPLLGLILWYFLGPRDGKA